jgi:TRAP-type C4-dicarboxylate transport system substrate-binding protein
MKKHTLAVIILCIITLSVSPSFCLIIKLGSLAPNGSPWDKALRKISAEWAAISNNAVTLKIYSGGVAGGEEDMIRKMRIGQLNAAGLTGVGMCRVFPVILAIQLPLLVRNDKELYYTLEKMRPKFEKELEDKGFKVLIWTKVGWVHFFSKSPVVKPDDLKTHKLFNYAGDPDNTQAWKTAGFNPVPMDPTELMTALQSGMVNAFSTTPLSAAAYQWFGLAKNMCGMNWAPLIGGIVIATKTWNQIPDDLKPKLYEAAQKIGRDIQAEIDNADAQAITIMSQHGLVVHPVSPEIEKLWLSVVEKGFNAVIGKSFDEASYNEVKSHLTSYRESHGK